jgi:hypothetical protein
MRFGGSKEQARVAYETMMLQSFREAHRVLKPGGRIMVSDMVLLKELSAELKSSFEAYVACIAGAILKEKYLNLIKAAGFTKVKTANEPISAVENVVGGASDLINSITSIRVSGIKPDAR